MNTRPPVPDWVPWEDLRDALDPDRKLSVRSVKRRALAAGARVFCRGRCSKGVLRADVPLLYHVRRLDQ